MGKKFLTSVSFFLCAVLFLSVFGVFYYGISSTSATASGIVVVLDAGHGGIDGGVVGRSTGTPESVVNLSIVRKMEKKFITGDVFPVLTRSTDAGLYDFPTKGFKRRDMMKRKEIIDRANPSAVVSVHQNSCVGKSQRGGQVFYRPGSEESKRLAECLQAKMNEVNPFGSKRSVLPGDYFMLNCTTAPSVIVECGFMTDREEEKYLVTESYQEILAGAICSGIREFLFCDAV